MRYCRQNLLRILNKKKQKLLANSQVSVIGLGALGTRISELLARTGVKSFILVDRDIVDITNLQRQTLYTETDINTYKAEASTNHLLEIDSSLKIKTLIMNLNKKNIPLIASNLIIDCTDNQETKLLLNEFAVENKIPLIYGSVLQTKGYVFNALPNKNSPCLACFIKKPTEFLGGCDIHGILNTACSLIASIQANEAIKILTRQKPEKSLIMADIWKNEITKIKVKKNKGCEVCSHY
jgi:molybdopterin/thiamine biosynthesis adenylyltransferase